jgi:hypothetical protein
MLYLARWQGAGTRRDPFRPEGIESFSGLPFGALDLRPLGSGVDGVCLLWVPDSTRTVAGLVKMGVDPDDPTPAAVRTVLRNRLELGVNDDDTQLTSPRKLIERLMFAPGRKWKPVMCDRAGRKFVHIGGREFARALIDPPIGDELIDPTDTFTRANENPATGWTMTANSFQIFANRLSPLPGNADSIGYYTAYTPAADHYSEITFGASVGDDSNGDCSPMVRMATANPSGYALNWADSSQILYKVDTVGGFTLIAGGFSGIANAAPGTVIRLTATGSSLDGLYNGGAIGGLPHTDTSYATGRAGIHIFDPNVKLGQWTGADVGGGSGITGTSTAGLPLGGSAAAAVAIAATSTRALPIGGQIAGAVAIAAQSTKGLPLAGSAQGVVAIVGGSTAALPLSGLAAAVAQILGSSTRALPLAGSSTGTMQIIAVSTQPLPLGGSITVQIAIAGSSTRPLPLGGSIVGGAPQANAASSAALPLSGTVTVQVSVQGTSIRALPLGGAAAAQALIQAISTAALPLAGQINVQALIRAVSVALLPLSGLGAGTVGIVGSSIRPLPLVGSASGAADGRVAVSIAALPLGGIIIGTVSDALAIVKYPSRGQLRMAKFWDALVAQVETPRLQEILGGRGRVYSPFDGPREREGAQDMPWGRVRFIGRTNLWPQIDVPGDWKNVAFIASVQFNDFRADGYRVDIAVEAAHGELLDLMDGWAPSQADVDDLAIMVPVWRYSTPPVKAMYDSQRRLWVSNAQYRTQAIPRVIGG